MQIAQSNDPESNIQTEAIFSIPMGWGDEDFAAIIEDVTSQERRQGSAVFEIFLRVGEKPYKKFSDSRPALVPG